LRNEAKKFLGFNVGWASGAEHCQMVLSLMRRLKWDPMVPGYRDTDFFSGIPSNAQNQKAIVGGRTVAMLATL
jgi:hypothetical protein